MQKLRILIVEDDPNNPGALLNRLHPPKFKCELRTTASTALSVVEEDHFDVVFIDLQLTDRNERNPYFEGVPLAENIRKRLSDIVIVVYSGHINRGEESNFPYYQSCLDAGADAVLSRTELFTTGADKLESRIRDWTNKKRETARARLHVAFDEGMRTKAVLEIFNRPILESILAESVKPRKHVRVTALQAGWSGAAILRAISAEDAEFTAPSRTVIKLSNSSFALKDELQRQPISGSQLDSVSVSALPQAVIHREGIYAISIPEVRERILLRDFLSGASMSPAEKATLKRVVVDLLVAPALEARAWEKFNINPDDYRFRATAGCEILDFVAEASSWTTILKHPQLVAIRAVEAFVKRMLAGNWNFTIRNRLAARLHGDFHCRNVFVAANEAPVLIDFGRSEVYPRLFDFAALDADLLIGCVDSSDGKDQDFRKIDLWYEYAAHCYPFKTAGRPSVQNDFGRAGSLRSVLLFEMTTKLPDVTPAEYQETLLFQMLRYVRFSNIALPKKILALRLAARLTSALGLTSIEGAIEQPEPQPPTKKSSNQAKRSRR